MTTAEDLEWIGDRLNALRHYPLVDEVTVQNLQPVDNLLYRAGLLGSDPMGLYKPLSLEERRRRGSDPAK
jgi:hypothetical protein